MGFVTGLCGAGAYWAWGTAWDGGTRVSVVIAALGGYCTLLAMGSIFFPAPKEPKVLREDYMVNVVVPWGDDLHLLCYSYEDAFKLAMFAQLRAFELHGVWLTVSIDPDRPERTK